MPFGYFTSIFIRPLIVPGSDGGTPDLMAAVVAKLRGTAEVTLALGEVLSDPKTIKIHADDMAFRCDLPWLTYGEPESEDSYMSPGADGSKVRIEEGTFVITVSAAGKRQARAIGDLVYAALNDADLTFDDGRLMYLRARKPSFAPASTDGASVSNVAAYRRVIAFDFMIQRNQ